MRLVSVYILRSYLVDPVGYEGLITRNYLRIRKLSDSKPHQTSHHCSLSISLLVVLYLTTVPHWICHRNWNVSQPNVFVLFSVPSTTFSTIDQHINVCWHLQHKTDLDVPSFPWINWYMESFTGSLPIFTTNWMILKNILLYSISLFEDFILGCLY